MSETAETIDRLMDKISEATAPPMPAGEALAVLDGLKDEIDVYIDALKADDLS